MNILLVIDGMHPRDGGPPIVVGESARGLRDRGHEVTVLTTLQPSDEEDVRHTWREAIGAGVRFAFCRPHGLKALAGLGGIDPLVEREIAAADVVHIHSFWNPIALVAGRFARRHGIPYFVSVHGVLDHRAMRRLPAKWIKKRVAIELFDIRGFLAGAAALVFGSEAEAEHSWLPTSDVRLAFVPNGADPQLGTALPSKDQNERLLRVAPEFGRWRRRLLYRSRIHEEKGLATLIEAFNRIAGEFPDVGILAAGLEQDVDYQRQVETLIAEGPAADRIVLTTALTGPETRFLYLSCDAFLLPSVAEGFSMALVEALASARPVLITRYCHMPIVETAGVGFVVDPTPEAIADGLRRLLSMSDTETAAMGDRARRLFLDNFTWERVSEQLDTLYQGVCSQPVPAAA